MSAPSAQKPWSVASRPWAPWVVPFAVWLLGLIPQQISPAATVWAYPLRTIVVGVLLIFWRRTYADLRPNWHGSGVLAGLAVLLLWIGLDPVDQIFRTALRSFGLLAGDGAGAWTPQELRNRSEAGFWTWAVFRIFGSSVVVAVIEELFWRGFLMRWIINADFRKVPLGAFTWKSFLVTALLFGFEHDRVVAGFAAGVVYGALLCWRKNLFLCILAHGLTNFLLGLWVLQYGDWQFW
ncbi:MAG: CAAX prenyl protease-related protein [Verrucomicrobiae bacterium]|nr:CAAX prenyl protease-related protein [Verrucomicrobiae bacterium]